MMKLPRGCFNLSPLAGWFTNPHSSSRRALERVQSVPSLSFRESCLYSLAGGTKVSPSLRLYKCVKVIN